MPDAWPRHLAAAVDLAEALPELTVVIDHLGKASTWHHRGERYRGD
jgi:predicted TIM-barrel fold metal-dependent hydrolase